MRLLNKTLKPIGSLNDPEGFGCLGEKYLHDLAVKNGSPQTIENKHQELIRFVDWCSIRSIECPAGLTLKMAEGYQKHLHHYRKDDGKPLSITTQRGRLTIIKMFYRWLVKTHYLPYSPWENIELPKLPKQLPKAVFSEQEVEKVLQQADVNTPVGLRDRAIMETLYSTGIRRKELLSLQINDVDRFRGLVRINEGKGQKDRIIPIGERALYWIGLYLTESRPELVNDINEQTLFISHFGSPLSRSTLTERLRDFIVAAGIDKPGSVHVFRHTTATLMLENGADIRHIQAMLGHEDLSTTQVYTHVAVTHLKDVHRQTHPAKLKGKRKQSLH